MKALVITENQRLELQDIPKPVLSEGRVLVKVAYCGICGSDMPRYFEGGVHSFPQVVGHEFSGVIEEVSEDEKTLKIGDRVVVAPLVPCGKCPNCKIGEPALCLDYSFIGSREQGAMAEYVSVPSENCVMIPESLSLKEAALLEPLTVALHGIERLKINAGSSVLILGSGTIGLLTLLSLRARGAGQIVVVDVNENKLDKAKELGADIVLNPLENSLDNYYKENNLPEVILETAGNSLTQAQAIKFAKKKGKVIFVGTSTNDVVLSSKTFENILRGELEITGSWMSYSAPFPGYEWKAGLRYMSDGSIDVKPLISKIYKLEDVEKPFNKMKEGNSDTIKVLYEIGGEA